MIIFCIVILISKRLQFKWHEQILTPYKEHLKNDEKLIWAQNKRQSVPVVTILSRAHITCMTLSTSSSLFHLQKLSLALKDWNIFWLAYSTDLPFWCTLVESPSNNVTVSNPIWDGIPIQHQHLQARKLSQRLQWLQTHQEVMRYIQCLYAHQGFHSCNEG